MIRTINVKLNAAHPELPLCEAVTYTGSPSAVFVCGVPKDCGKWSITSVNVAVTFPDGSISTHVGVEGANGVWAATLPATATSGRTANGLRILADGIDENGAAVTGYVLGVADFAVLSLSSVPAPGQTSHQMSYFDEIPNPAKMGDVAKIDGVLKIYNGSAWDPFATPVILDDAVAPTSSNGVKSSGIWASIWGALTALPSGFSSLYDWVASQLNLKASKSDATLTERGFGPWTFSPATIVEKGVLRTLYMGINPETGEGFPAFDDAEYGQIHYGESRDLAETTEQIWHAGIETPCTENITATRTAMPGYVLGTQTGKPLASEAEAEELRTAIAGLAQNNDYDRLSNKPQINSVTLSGNKTGADLGLLDLTGGKMTGEFSVGGSYDANFQVVPEKDTGSSCTPPTMRFSDGAGVVGIIWRVEKGYVEMEVSDVMSQGFRIALPSASGTLALREDIPHVPSPTAPVASATLAWQSNRSAIVVSVPANGTLSATLTGWIEGQSQTALITLAAGTSVSPEVKLVGYGTWPTGGQFLASAIRVGNNVYVTPIILAN